jgi:hypothetical protein
MIHVKTDSRACLIDPKNLLKRLLNHAFFLLDFAKILGGMSFGEMPSRQYELQNFGSYPWPTMTTMVTAKSSQSF